MFTSYIDYDVITALIILILISVGGDLRRPAVPFMAGALVFVCYGAAALDAMLLIAMIAGMIDSALLTIYSAIGR